MKCRFMGPKDPFTEGSVAIIVNGRTVGIGDEFEADAALLAKLDRFKIEKVTASPSKIAEPGDQDAGDNLSSSKSPYPSQGVK